MKYLEARRHCDVNGQRPVAELAGMALLDYARLITISATLNSLGWRCLITLA